MILCEESCYPTFQGVSLLSLGEPAMFIEKSKRRMIAEDITEATKLLDSWTPSPGRRAVVRSYSDGAAGGAGRG